MMTSNVRRKVPVASYLLLPALLLCCVCQGDGHAEENAQQRWTAARIESGSRADWQRAVDAVSREQRAIAQGLLRVLKRKDTSLALAVHVAKYFSGIHSPEGIDWCYDHILCPRVPPIGRVGPDDINKSLRPVFYILVDVGIESLPGAIRFLERRKLSEEELKAVADVLGAVLSPETAASYVRGHVKSGQGGRFLAANAPRLLEILGC